VARRISERDDVPVATAAGQTFRLVIEKAIALAGRPGLHLAGEIEPGIVQVGDHLSVLGSGTLIRGVGGSDNQPLSLPQPDSPSL
jgi:translation elongation factor EF-Tu-like GTPase